MKIRKFGYQLNVISSNNNVINFWGKNSEQLKQNYVN